MTPTYVTAAHLKHIDDQLVHLDRQLIETLSQTTYATTRQLEQLCLPAQHSLARARRIRRRLHHLRSLHVIHTLERSIGGRNGGSPQAIHTLDRAGYQLATPDASRLARPARDRGQAHIQHVLAVTQHLVDLRAYEGQHAAVRVVLWLGEPACHVPYRELGRLVWLAPDALIEVHTPTERIVSMLEVDRGTESLTTLVRKADRYLNYAATRPEAPQVVWSLHHRRRVDRFRAALHGRGRPRVSARLADQLFVITTPDSASAGFAGEEQPR